MTKTAQEILNDAMQKINEFAQQEGLFERTAPYTWRYWAVRVSKNRVYKYGWTTSRVGGKFQSFRYIPTKTGWILDEKSVRKFNKRISAKRNATSKAQAHERRVRYGKV